VIYNVLVSSEPAPNEEFEYEVTVELLGDDNPEFDIPNGPHAIKIESDDWIGRLTIVVIDTRVREWLREKFGIES
jgi:hypothetical protein